MTEYGSAPIPERGASCPPTVVLECLAAGDQVERPIAEHVRSCTTCSGYVEQLEAGRAAFLKQRPTDLFVRLLKRQKAPSGLRAGTLGWAALGASLAILFLFLKPDVSIQTKGGAFQVVYKRPGISQPQPVTADLRLRAGDALRFSFAAPRDGYLLILEVDANGKVTSFYPLGGSQSAHIRSGPAQFLPGSVLLDNAPGPEWLIAVFSLASLQVDGLVQTLPATSSLVPPKLTCGDCQVETIRIQKEL